MTDAKQQKIFTDNLVRLMEEHEMRQVDIASALKISKTTVNSWIKGVAIPRMGTIQRLCDIFNVPKSHLIDEHIDQREPFYLNKKEAHLVETYRTLPPSDREEVIGYVDYRASKVVMPTETVAIGIPRDDIVREDFGVTAAHADSDITPEDVQENIRRIKEELAKRRRI